MNSFKKINFCAVIVMTILSFSLIKADSNNSSAARNPIRVINVIQTNQLSQQQGQNSNSSNSQNWSDYPGYYGDEPNPFHNYYNPFPQKDFNNTPMTPNYNPFPQEDYNNQPQI